MEPESQARPILVIDSQESAADLSACLRAAGYPVEIASQATRARRALNERSFGVVLCDPTAVKLDIAALCQALTDPPAWIQLAGFGSVEDAVDAVRSGAFDYVCKPFSEEELLVSVARALEQSALKSENRTLKEQLSDRYELGRLNTRDPQVQRILATIEAVADTRTTILIEGESGTGKSLIARTVHQQSSRRSGPFVEVNCGALPDQLLESELFGHAKGAFTGAVRDKLGKFEEADRGTIFLDEIGTATPDLQVKLLRVLQDRTFERLGDNKTRTSDVRVIAATNTKLEDEVRAGRFREDLFWRLRVIAFELPPLRDRPADVPWLAEHFVKRFATEHARGVKVLAPAALARIVKHRWPGNVRELEHTLERAVLLSHGETITVSDLGLGDEATAHSEFEGSARAALAEPHAFQPGVPLRLLIEGPEREFIQAALAHCRGNRNETAQLLDINRTTLFNKMRKYNLMEFPGRPE